MADKAQIDTREAARPDGNVPCFNRDAEIILDMVRWQTNALRYIGREATVVVFGKAERAYLDGHFRALGHKQKADDAVERLFGLEVKIDGDVGVRVG